MNTRRMHSFKETLEGRKAQILKNIRCVHNELNQLSSCELNDEGDHVATNNSAIIDNILVTKQEEELRNINRALSKVKSGHYGTCDMCGVEISFQRLSVKPHAIYCIECREIIENTEGKRC